MNPRPGRHLTQTPTGHPEHVHRFNADTDVCTRCDTTWADQQQLHADFARQMDAPIVEPQLAPAPAPPPVIPKSDTRLLAILCLVALLVTAAIVRGLWLLARDQPTIFCIAVVVVIAGAVWYHGESRAARDAQDATGDEEDR